MVVHTDTMDDLDSLSGSKITRSIVTVNNPITHSTWDEGHFTNYAINVKTNDYSFSFPESTVRRRYSEFLRLRRLLKLHHPSITPPTLPPKTLLFANRFDASFIETRRNGLEKFLKEIVANALYLSNRALHLFMQSNITLDDIEILVEADSPMGLPEDDFTRIRRTIVPKVESPTVFIHCPDNMTTATTIEKGSSVPDSVSSTASSLNSHSHVTLGSRITICSPNLEVPGSTDSCASSLCSNPTCYSPASSFSPPANGFLTRRFPRTRSMFISPNSPLLKRKRVSFSDDVLVNHFES